MVVLVGWCEAFLWPGLPMTDWFRLRSMSNLEGVILSCLGVADLRDCRLPILLAKGLVAMEGTMRSPLRSSTSRLTPFLLTLRWSLEIARTGSTSTSSCFLMKPTLLMKRRSSCLACLDKSCMSFKACCCNECYSLCSVPEALIVLNCPKALTPADVPRFESPI